MRHPEAVRKLVVASVSRDNDGAYPEMLAGIEHITPEAFAGTPWKEEYDRVAPSPEDFPTLVAKLKELDLTFAGWPPEEIQAIESPTLLIIGLSAFNFQRSVGAVARNLSSVWLVFRRLGKRGSGLERLTPFVIGRRSPLRPGKQRGTRHGWSLWLPLP